MTHVDLTGWSFNIGGTPKVFDEAAHYFPPTILNFQAPLDLLLYLANNGVHQPEIQSSINRRLIADPIAQTWHKKRTYLKDMLHFPKYQKTYYDTYHMAARALASNTDSQKQRAMVVGLNQEISASKVIVPSGQILFHGRADLTLHSAPSYASFVSTSLDPVVAINSALRRGGVKQTNGRSVVYILTMLESLHALWGNCREPHEWELLLETNLSFQGAKVHSGNQFDIVEVGVGR